MTQKEQQRAHVLGRVQAGTLDVQTAAGLLTLSVRHVRRLLADVRRRGIAALAHGNRGRPSPQRLAEPLRVRILTLARTTYAGVNDHQLTELLQEREALHISRPTSNASCVRRASAVPARGARPAPPPAGAHASGGAPRPDGRQPAPLARGPRSPPRPARRGIERSRLLEPLCLLWVAYGIRSKSWDHAFKVLRK